MAQPGYVIAQIDVPDLDVYFEKYATPTLAQLEAAGAEILVATPNATTLEGEWSGNWTVVIRFPSVEAARTWYESDQYAPLKRVRTQEVTSGGNLALAEGFDPAALA